MFRKSSKIRNRRPAGHATLRGESRQMRAILAIVLPTVGLGAIATYLAPPQFTAESAIRVESLPSASRKTSSAGGSLEPREFNRHIRLLAGPAVAKRVIAQLEPDTEILHEPASVFELAARRLQHLLPGPGPAGRPSDAQAYAGRLGVHPASRSRLVRIAFTTSDPERSAEIANAHARAYLEIAPEQLPRVGSETWRRLGARAKRATAAVGVARAALDSHRTKHDISSIEARSNVVITRLSRLDRRHLEAEAERLRLETQVRLIEDDQFNSLPAVMASDLVWHLKESIAQLEAQHVRLQAELRPDVDQLNAVEGRLRGVQRRLGVEIDIIVAEITADFAAAEATEEGIRAELDEQRQQAENLSNAVTGYARLERELVTHQRLQQDLQQQLLELESLPAPASRISVAQNATPPALAARARPVALLASVILGLCGGLAFAFVRRGSKPTFETPEQVEHQLGMPTLGALPDFRRLASGCESASSPGESADAEAPFGSTGAADRQELSLIRQQGMDAFREIRSRIIAATPSEPPCSLLFAGATAGAGNTSVALNIAALLSRLNKPVLVIDADFRGPHCHEVLHAENSVGLTDVLLKRVEPCDAIRGISEHLFLLPAGPMPADPTELLASTEMAECLIELQKHYAYIIVDGPPLEPASDSLLLCPLFDGVILVADQPSSARVVVQRAAEALRSAKARTLGIIVNRAPGVSLQAQDVYA